MTLVQQFVVVFDSTKISIDPTDILFTFNTFQSLFKKFCSLLLLKNSCCHKEIKQAEKLCFNSINHQLFPNCSKVGWKLRFCGLKTEFYCILHICSSWLLLFLAYWKEGNSFCNIFEKKKHVQNSLSGNVKLPVWCQKESRLDL